MLLLDIGNTNIKIYHDGQIKRYKAVAAYVPQEKFYYINVNPRLEKVLHENSFAVNLAPFFQFTTHYKGMGIDRIAACYSVADGVVVDAGSAVTVDIMQNNVHRGGFILPGIGSYKECFANISSRLQYETESKISLDTLPQNTQDALLYATLKSIVSMIEIHAADQKIYLTGGDGKRLNSFLKHAVYDENLLFKGMQKVIKEMGSAC